MTKTITVEDIVGLDPAKGYIIRMPEGVSVNEIEEAAILLGEWCKTHSLKPIAVVPADYKVEVVPVKEQG